MPIVVLLINASKIIGVAGLIGVAANAISYNRYRKENFAPFDNPIDESQEILAAFPVDKDVDDGGFFFALATAPAHVEDKLDDAWIQFAKETPPKDEDDGAQSRDKQWSHETSEKGDGGVLQEAAPTATKSLEDELSHKSIDEGQSQSGAFDEWEVIDKGNGKGRSGSIAGDEGRKESASERRRIYPSGSFVQKESSADQSQLPRSKGTTEDPLLQFNFPKKGKKMAKIAMEAMIRGYEKFVEDDKTNVAAWHNVPKPEQRLKFWSDPDTEIKLAQGANVKVFRMGVDWTRIMPVEPADDIEQAVDWAAVDRYIHIIKKVREHGMQVMLTLFHHSLPPWAGAYGGWKMEKTVDYFLEFTKISVERFSSLVDFWITFNEPHVFAMLTYCAGAWPGGHPDLLETATSILPQGVFNRVMNKMAIAHLKAYDMIHDFCTKAHRRAKVGVSHHVSFMRPYGLFDTSAAVLSDKMTRYPYIDVISDKADFVGINYYGQEVVSAPGLKLVDNDEYSESGRCIYPDGLYRVLMAFHKRYKDRNLSYIITENGVSDATDYIRRPYLLEHLLAVRAAMDKGVPVQGYCFWTTSDNWEWADGYGPKFGLVAVDRDKELKRIPRPSYYLFSKIAKTGKVTKLDRDKAWAELQTAAAQGKRRPFYRAVDKNGLMYAGGLDIPIERTYVQRDWRFGHYQYDGLQDPISRFVRFLWRTVLSIRGGEVARSHSTPDSVPLKEQKKAQEQEEEEEEKESREDVGALLPA